MYQVRQEYVEDLQGGRSKSEIARLLDLSVPYVIDVLNGKQACKRTTAIAFCYLVNGKLNDFFRRI